MPMREALSEALLKCPNGTAIEFCQAGGHCIFPIEVQQACIVRRLRVLELQEGEGFQGLPCSLKGLRIDDRDKQPIDQSYLKEGEECLTSPGRTDSLSRI